MSEADNYSKAVNPVTGTLRAIVAYPLLGALLLFTLFVLELPCYIADRLFSKQRGNAFYWAQRAVARWFFRLLPFGQQRRINIRSEAFPEPCVIVCNHQSIFDLMLCSTLPVNARWFLRPWLLRVPLMGELNKLAMHIITDDSQSDPARAKGHDTALDWLDQGVSVLVFVEGGRTDDGKLRPFKRSPFVLAVEAGVPVVPVVLDGTGRAIPKDGILVGHPDFTLRALEPLHPPKADKEAEEEADDKTAEEGAEKADAEAEVRPNLEARAEALKDRAFTAMNAALSDLRDSAKKPSFPRIHGWVTRLGMFAAAVVLAFVAGLSIYVQNFAIAEPPEYTGDRTLKGTEISEQRLGDRTIQTLGDNWRRNRHGVNEIALSGSPWQRGYANARLTPELLERQERHLIRTARDFVPNSAAFWLLKHGIAVNNRNLPDYITEREALEVLGLVEGSVNHFPDDVPLYHRVLNYHAAHDISHLLIDNPLVARSDLIGCSAFAAWGDATPNGQLIVARNFDWEAGELFDEHKCVFYVWPDDGIPYVHVAWAGMAGAVTGMNAEGLSIHLNAARTDDFRWGRVGTPVSMLVRRVLEGASNIDEAYSIIEQAQVFVSDSYLVASRHDGRAVVIEKSPSHTAMRDPSRPGLLLQTNHLLDAHWAEDAANREQQERATSLYRWQRLEELTERDFGRLDRHKALEILRDKRGMGDKELGFGNRNAIDAGICCHSVIMNVSTGEMWVSGGPHTYGRYIYVPVTRTLEAKPQGALRMRLPAEMDLQRAARFAEGANVTEFRHTLRLTREAVRKRDRDAASALVRSLHNLNPNAFETAYFRGRVAYLDGKYADAARHFETALERDPHYAEVREEITVWLNRAESRR